MLTVTASAEVFNSIQSIGRSSLRLIGPARLHRQREAVEQLGCAGPARFLDLEDPELGGDPAGRGEAAAPAVGGEDPVAGDDDRRGVAAERDSDGLSRGGRADLPGDLPVASNLAAGDTPGRVPDAPLEFGPGEVERDIAKVRPSAFEQV